MDFLARREHSFFELSQKLSKKFPETDSDQLTAVIKTLRNQNLQSDDRFAESYVRYRRSRGFGYLHIKADLASRRVSEDTISLYLLIDDGWAAMVETLVLKKLKGDEFLPFGSKDHRRIMRFLTSRGFTSDQIRKGLQPWLV
ncbi:MAG: regulatory protein [Pseudohongiellaceae bacterium]|jgi:regulatory protein